MYQFSPSPGGRYEARGVNHATTTGTILISGSTHVKGSWVDIGSPTSFTYEMLLLTVFNNSSAANYVVDIGIKVGSDYFVIAADVYVSLRRRQAMGPINMPLALHVPAGSQLAARVQCNGTFSCAVLLTGCSNGLGGMPGYSQLALLSTITSSKGHVIDPGTTINTKGAVVQLTASSPTRVVALLMATDVVNDVARSAARWLFDLLLYSSTEYVLIGNIPLVCESSLDYIQAQFLGPWPCDIPAGTRIAARSQCTITTAGDRNFGLSLYGYVP